MPSRKNSYRVNRGNHRGGQSSTSSRLTPQVIVNNFSAMLGTPNQANILLNFRGLDSPTQVAVYNLLISQPSNANYRRILMILNPPTVFASTTSRLTSSVPTTSRLTTSRLTAYVPTTSSGPTPQEMVDQFSLAIGTPNEPLIYPVFLRSDNSTKDAVIKILLSQPSNKNYLTILNILNNNPAIPRVSGGRSTKSKKRTRKVRSRRHRR